jgi:hypothetical protein
VLPVTMQQLRQDRLLEVAAHCDGDPMHLAAMFGIGPQSSLRYARAATGHLAPGQLLDDTEDSYELGLFATFTVPWGNLTRRPGRRRHRADHRLRDTVTCGPAGGLRVGPVPVTGGQAARVARAAVWCQAPAPAAPS